ncbi:MAG TPA: histidine kinase [Pedococcus sp.]|jgi:signal transduction histidine kinase|nr:histidine kinase [Pedococcus sp.]
MSEGRDEALWRRPHWLVDVAVGLVLMAMFESLAWSRFGPGEHIAGPQWLTATLPLLMIVPLWWRRRYPLATWLLVLVGLVIQSVTSQNSAEGLEILIPLAIGSYSVAAYGARRRAVAGLFALLAGYSVFALEDRNFRSGTADALWATAFFGLAMVAAWLIGSFASSRRDAAQAAANARRAEELAREAAQAERSRVARDLHDVVSHNLSVVVVQAAGARASSQGQLADGALEKIETSAREALAEMRQLLGVLRTDDHARLLSPQPGLGDLDALIERVRSAGLPVDLTVEDGLTGLPAVVGLSAYRIIQEALTNTIKHAGPARAQVRVARHDGAVVLEVSDDGCGLMPTDEPGHGLAGMRERATLLGGDLSAEEGHEGGFVVRARLPLAGSTT